MVVWINHVQGVHVARTNILPLRSLKFEFLSIRMIKAAGTIIVAWASRFHIRFSIQLSFLVSTSAFCPELALFRFSVSPSASSPFTWAPYIVRASSSTVIRWTDTDFNIFKSHHLFGTNYVKAWTGTNKLSRDWAPPNCPLWLNIKCQLLAYNIWETPSNWLKQRKFAFEVEYS